MPANQSDLDMLKKALGDGSYGPDELTQQLVHSGYTPSDASALMKQAGSELAGPSQGGAPDTFLGESGFGNLWTAAKNKGSQMLWQLQHPTQPLPAQMQTHMDDPAAIWNGITKDTDAENAQAANYWRRGDKISAAGHAISGIPFVGHPLVHGVDNAMHGNYAGAAGDLVSLLMMRGLPESLGIGKALAKVGANVYRGTVRLPPSASLNDMDKAVALGMQEGVPATRSGLAKLGNVKASDTVLGGLEDQITPHITGANGQRPLDMNTVLQPVKDHALRAANDLTPSGQKYLSDFLDEYDGWQKAHPDGLNMADGQAEKRAMYKSIADNQYADNSSAIPTAAKKFKETVARGIKNGQNAVAPEMAGVNDLMHSGVQLHDALTNVLKKAPEAGREGLLWALGFGVTGTAATMGHPLMGTAGLLGLAARQAMHNPAVATRVALALGHSPEVLGALAGVSRAAGGGGVLARPLTIGDIQQLGEQPGQNSQAAPSNK